MSIHRLFTFNTQQRVRASLEDPGALAEHKYSRAQGARPEGPICCALSLGKGTTLSVATKHNICTLQATLST